ncbi:MAG: TatD family deoxyribonuclease [Candidatus Dadabacteria bacterium]|nr:MAG: TatD family deoxyribonuclease [Candidatus Dadabacteria bacterium]
MELFDTHTHLDAPEFDADREKVIERALAAGVTRLLNVGASRNLDSARDSIKLAEKYDFIYASVGVHPHDAGAELDFNTLQELATHPRVVAIGETGLDFYRDWSPRNSQYEWFKKQIKLALEVNKPLIIHSRETAKECFELLVDLGADAVGGVFHCYPADSSFAAKLREINFMVSFPGILTFKNAKDLQKAAEEIPLSQIMLETDAPYLAPVPYRGKRCESAFVVETAKKLAELKGIPLEDVARITTENALCFFKINGD